MNSLFDITPEKYWAFTSKFSDERKRDEIKNCIHSNLYIGSEKKDGDYSKTVKDFSGELRMESRTLSKVTGSYSDKKDHVPHIAKSLNKLPNGTILIGELHFPDRSKTSQDVGKILRCLSNKAVKRQEDEEKLIYYIHDCWYYNGQDLMNTPYEERIATTEFIYNNFLRDNPYIECARWKTEPQDIENELEKVFSLDGEGIVLVRKDAVVEPGKRTAWKTLKVKRELDNHIDCFFTGNYKAATREYTGKEIETWPYWENIKTNIKSQGEYFDLFDQGQPYEPVTKNYFYGYAGSLEIGVYDTEKNIVPIGYLSGLTDEMKEHPENFAMHPCEVTCMNFTNDGNLRHPKLVRMRDDISPIDCTLDKI